MTSGLSPRPQVETQSALSEFLANEEFAKMSSELGPVQALSSFFERYNAALAVFRPLVCRGDNFRKSRAGFAAVDCEPDNETRRAALAGLCLIRVYALHRPEGKELLLGCAESIFEKVAESIVQHMGGTAPAEHVVVPVFGHAVLHAVLAYHIGVLLGITEKVMVGPTSRAEGLDVALYTVQGHTEAFLVTRRGVRFLACPLESKLLPTAPIAGQKPGTSGLRKKTKVFMGKNYLANFVQSTFDALAQTNAPVQGGTLVVSGDGRFYNPQAIQIILQIAVAAGVKRIWVGKDGLLSTPAVSAVIREREGGFKPFGAFILTASHNPGGITEDFGIKYNCENGGPAPESLTNAIHKNTETIQQLHMAAQFPTISLSQAATHTIGDVTVEVFDATEDHVSLLQKVFAMDKLKALIGREGGFSFKYDSMSGVQGVYARRVFLELLGADDWSLLNATPKEDFGGPKSASHGHADPNLKNAVELIQAMGIKSDGRKVENSGPFPDFGAAADGDADRNMICGTKFFVTPSDSVAIITRFAQDCIPFFAGGLKGCARSMPTSCALDRVAKDLNVPCFEVPTGWKFFGNLMDSASTYGKTDYTPFICGEESFGTGSNHVREKDGMWAVLAWLSILAHHNPDPAAELVGVEDIVTEHWKKYGRNYYVRYDYEGVEKAAAEEMMARMAADGRACCDGVDLGNFELATADMFEYHDPVDGSVSKNQGIRFIFTDGSRIVFRLSGTGVDGATIRLYLEKYVDPTGSLDMYAPEVVRPLAEIALKLSLLAEKTGRDEPSVIT
eukprot:gene3457-4343_t